MGAEMHGDCCQHCHTADTTASVVDRLDKTITGIDTLLRGDAQGSPGVVGRLDRLEVSDRKRVSMLKAAFAAILSLVTERAHSLFGGH